MGGIYKHNFASHYARKERKNKNQWVDSTDPEYHGNYDNNNRDHVKVSQNWWEKVTITSLSILFER